MSAPVLTAKAYCLEATCGWACEGGPASVAKEEARHRTAFKHGTSLWVHNPQAPVRTPSSGTGG